MGQVDDEFKSDSDEDDNPHHVEGELQFFSDDFYKDIDLSSLIFYCERNNSEMQKVINSATRTHFFNNPKDYVGHSFT